jgi:hypothetical protein
MSDCGIEAPGGGVLAMADALRRNTNLQRLELERLDETYLIPILNSLPSNTSVRELRLGCLSLDVAHAVENLLKSTVTIQKFEFTCVSVRSPEVDTFRPIAQGLIQSASVTAVTFQLCIFDDQEQVLILNSIFQSKSNLHALAFTNCYVQDNIHTEFHAAIFSLLQPHSLLRSLERQGGSIFGFQTALDFGRLLTAVETSPLERFSLGRIDSRETCLGLIASIPKMQVRTLELKVEPYLVDTKGGMMRAIKRNTSIRTVVAMDHILGDWFDDDDKRKLMAYSARNEFLAHWIGSPTTDAVPVAAWPEYLAAVTLATGPDPVFGILRALAPCLGPLFEGEQSRKRRRSSR